MKKNFIILTLILLFILFLKNNVFALTSLVIKNKFTEKEILEQFTLEDLHHLATMLLLISDEKKSYCGLNSKEAQNLLLPLHPLIDKKIKLLSKNKKYIKKIEKNFSNCAVKCTCGVYKDLLSASDVKNKNNKVKSLNYKASIETDQNRIQCINLVYKKFCNSTLLNFLKKEYENSYKL
jgi:hypothetical protein